MLAQSAELLEWFSFQKRSVLIELLLNLVYRYPESRKIKSDIGLPLIDMILIYRVYFNLLFLGIMKFMGDYPMGTNQTELDCALKILRVCM